MKLISDETRQARANLLAAHHNLDAIGESHKGCVDECDAYLAANRAVIEAERPLPWWKRVDFFLGIYPSVHDNGGRGRRS